MHILVTGAAGRIGTVLSEALAPAHTVRGVDLRQPIDAFPGEFVAGDCAEQAIASQVVAGVDAVIHLAGLAREAELTSILRSHVETTAALLDAMVEHKVGRMVYASSNHAVGMAPRVASLGVDLAPRPDTFYGVGKVAAEALLSLYADRYSISSVAMRIGSFAERPTTRRGLSTWLSYGDCVRMVEASLAADFHGVRTIYGISANSDGWWDLTSGRDIGYQPVDDAAEFDNTVPNRPEDEDEAQRVGGHFAIDGFDRWPMPNSKR